MGGRRPVQSLGSARDPPLDGGFATRAEFDRIPDAGRAWAADPDGWLIMPCGEIIACA